MKIWNEPGRGRKGCPECGIYVGVRTMKCQCGFSWTLRKASEKNEDGVQMDGKPIRKGFSLVHAPPGLCPHELGSIETTAVRDWLAKLVRHHETKKELIKPYAAKYYARLFYNVFSDEYFQLSDKIDTMAKEVGLHVD